MRRTLGTIGIITLEALGLYLAYAFITLETNPSTWGVEARAKLIFFLLFIAILTSTVRHREE